MAKKKKAKKTAKKKTGKKKAKKRRRSGLVAKKATRRISRPKARLRLVVRASGMKKSGMIRL